ncbi:extracellular solute-binding protein [Paenibacillus sp. HB172176]|uniref:extracellular solute-binding protein n=1 Tax=Paenibacillus sp. HB172176 TaxID=2493690 RepID=UPI00143AD032|nr:extracellular solute-binding protein [Paenibacillus sp. HB172176]
MRKQVTILAVFVLLVSMLAACSSNNNNGGNNPTVAPSSSSDTATAAPTEEVKGPPAKLSMIVQSAASWPLKEDWLVYQLLEDYANVDLTVTGYQGNWWEAIPLVVASGDMPDMMWMSGPDIIHQYGEDGALVDLNEHLDEMPNMKAWMDEHQEVVNKLLSSDGKLYMTPAEGAYGDYDGLWMYREDIFKKNNLNIPKTYDELYETLKKLKEIYPDSYPLYIPGFGQMNYISLSYGSNNTFYYNNDEGKWKFGPAEDNYRQAVEFLAKAYQEGLIPKEFGNLNGNKKNEMITTDKTFITYGYINNIDSYNSLVRPTNPDFKMAAFAPPGGAGHEGVNGSKFIFQEGLTVTSTSKNKEAAFKFLDSLYTDEAREMVSWGKEGVTYEKVDGKNQYLPVVSDTNVRSIDFGLRTAGTNMWFDNDANIALFNDETKESYLEAAKYVAPAEETVVFTADERDKITLKSQAIGKYVNENVSKFIIGQKPMSDWDAYVKGIEDLGLDDVLAVYEEAWARQQ